MPHWFEAMAEHMGEAYHRYSFTKGTENEVTALIDMLELESGERVLDIGCGPGRHSLALAERGFNVTGLDVSQRFVELANAAAETAGLQGPGAGGARFVVGDARESSIVDSLPGPFDAVISLCQGAFGLAGGAGAQDELPHRELDEPILIGMKQALRPGGRVAVSAFSAYFQLQYLEDQDTFDARTGVNHEHTEVRDPAGKVAPADLWTTCFTPRELRLLARIVGLTPEHIFGVTPGDYGARPPSLDRPEFLLIARRDTDKVAAGRTHR